MTLCSMINANFPQSLLIYPYDRIAWEKFWDKFQASLSYSVQFLHFFFWMIWRELTEQQRFPKNYVLNYVFFYHSEAVSYPNWGQSCCMIAWNSFDSWIMMFYFDVTTLKAYALPKLSFSVQVHEVGQISKVTSGISMVHPESSKISVLCSSCGSSGGSTPVWGWLVSHNRR